MHDNNTHSQINYRDDPSSSNEDDALASSYGDDRLDGGSLFVEDAFNLGQDSVQPI